MPSRSCLNTTSLSLVTLLSNRQKGSPWAAGRHRPLPPSIMASAKKPSSSKTLLPTFLTMPASLTMGSASGTPATFLHGSQCLGISHLDYQPADDPSEFPRCDVYPQGRLYPLRPIRQGPQLIPIPTGSPERHGLRNVSPLPQVDQERATPASTPAKLLQPSPHPRLLPNFSWPNLLRCPRLPCEPPSPFDPAHTG
jgi:hypothetical protein